MANTEAHSPGRWNHLLFILAHLVFFVADSVAAIVCWLEAMGQAVVWERAASVQGQEEEFNKMTQHKVLLTALDGVLVRAEHCFEFGIF